MAAWTSADVLLVAPELATAPAISAATFDFFIAMVERELDPAVFGNRIVEAGSLLTAHYMIRLGYGKNAGGAGGAGAAVGGLSSVTVGRVSMSFGGAGSVDDGTRDAVSAELKTTRQGSIFLALVLTLTLTPIVLTGPEILGVL